MKPSKIIAIGLLVGACSSTSHERPSSMDEQQERMQAQRASAHDNSTAPSVPGSGPAEPIRNDFDQDGDRISDADEANVANVDPTNTALNDRTGPEGPTAIDQSNNSSDIEITQAIRKKVIADDDLSFNAKNVKIITVAGKVTLRGPVETSQESAEIERSARTVPGVARVDNQLEVKR